MIWNICCNTNENTNNNDDNNDNYNQNRNKDELQSLYHHMKILYQE